MTTAHHRVRRNPRPTPDTSVSALHPALGSEVLLSQTAPESPDLLVDGNRQRVITAPDHPNSAVIRIRGTSALPQKRCAKV